MGACCGMHSFDDRTRPFLPPEKPPGIEIVRAALAEVIAALGGSSAAQIAADRWPNDRITRAAVTPTDTASASALGSSIVSGFVASLAPRAASAAVLGAGLVVDLGQHSTIKLPRADNSVVAIWVAEGAPAPLAQGNLLLGELGPVKKLLIMSAVTEELAGSSAAEAVIGEILRTACARALDTTLFGSGAATAAAPAGLRNGVAGLVAATGGGAAAAMTDVRALTDAIVAAGGGTDIRLVMQPGRAVALQGLLPGFNPLPVHTTAFGVAANEILAVDAAALASSFAAAAEIEASRDAAVHFESATPLPISTPGTPNTVAAPVLSAFQAGLIVLRARLPATWVMRLAGGVAHITGCTW